MRTLVITTVGKKHCANSWRGASNDIILISYVHEQVFKYPGIHKEITSRGLWDYDYYWMPDEDIEATPECVEGLFNEMGANGLDLAQPSILRAEDSFPSWDRFVHRDGDDIIPTDFVEVMCPIFSHDSLKACIETFPKSMSGYGLDLAWSKILEGKSIAIINSITVKHTRPIGTGGLYAELKKRGILRSQEKKRLMKEYGIKEHSIWNDNSADSITPREG